MDAIYYYLADSELELDEVKAITDWQEYNGAFQINPNNRYVIYAKAVDKNGNTTYINSAKGIVLDSIAPVLYGIENGGVYHGDKIFKAVDDNFLKIEVDGVDVTDTTEGDDEYKIVADNAEHIAPFKAEGYVFERPELVITRSLAEYALYDVRGRARVLLAVAHRDIVENKYLVSVHQSTSLHIQRDLVARDAVGKPAEEGADRGHCEHDKMRRGVRNGRVYDELAEIINAHIQGIAV